MEDRSPNQRNIISLIGYAGHWRERAEEARTMADAMNNPEAKRVMSEIAWGYDQLAEKAMQRARDQGRREGRDCPTR